MQTAGLHTGGRPQQFVSAQLASSPAVEVAAVPQQAARSNRQQGAQQAACSPRTAGYMLGAEGGNEGHGMASAPAAFMEVFQVVKVEAGAGFWPSPPKAVLMFFCHCTAGPYYTSQLPAALPKRHIAPLSLMQSHVLGLRLVIRFHRVRRLQAHRVLNPGPLGILADIGYVHQGAKRARNKPASDTTGSERP